MYRPYRRVQKVLTALNGSNQIKTECSIQLCTSICGGVVLADANYFTQLITFKNEKVFSLVHKEYEPEFYIKNPPDYYIYLLYSHPF